MRALLLCSALLLLGCPRGDDTEDGAAGPPDAGSPDLGCYRDPRTHIELINACTTAQSIDKTPVLPLLNKDGTLPPLP